MKGFEEGRGEDSGVGLVIGVGPMLERRGDGGGRMGRGDNMVAHVFEEYTLAGLLAFVSGALVSVDD